VALVWALVSRSRRPKLFDTINLRAACISDALRERKHDAHSYIDLPPIFESSANNGLQVMRSGKLAGFTADVALVFYYNGAVYQENTASLWWPWGGSTWPIRAPRALALGVRVAVVAVLAQLAAAAVEAPVRVAPAPQVAVEAHRPQACSSMACVNGHYAQASICATNIAQQVKDMQAMGIKSIRQDCYSTSDTATMASLVSQFSPIVIQPIFNVYPSTTNETTAYNQFYTYGQTVAGQLAGEVPVIELMNELENQYFSSAPSGSGQLVTNWSASNNQWPAFRGAVRGFIAGFRSVDTTKQTLIASPSVGWLHYGWLEGL
jgi:hypothetical protein